MSVCAAEKANEARNKKILTCYYRPKPGGFCKRYFRAIRALLNHGHEVHYLAVVKFPIDHPKCHFHRLPWPEKHTDTLLFWFVFHLLTPWYLLAIAIRHDIEKAFAFGPTYSLLLQAVRIGKKVPVALFLRADTIRCHISKRRKTWIVELEKLLEGLAIQGVSLYSVSECLLKTVLRRHNRFVPARSSVFRNNVETLQHKQTVKPPAPLVIGCVGMLESGKNQQLLVRCLRDLPQADCKLLLFGNGPQESTLRKLTEECDVSTQVEFKG